MERDDADTDLGPEEIELSVPLDTVCYIIQKAHDLQGKTATSHFDDESGDPDDAMLSVLEEGSFDPVAQELESVISDLPEDGQIDLVALMWLGRDEEDWAELRALAEQEHTSGTVAYLLGTPLLADHLRSGLEALGLDCTEWEAENL